MTDSNERLERRYRRLLGLYPRSYRQQHEEDMLGVLMNEADSKQSRPGLAQTLDLLRGALFISGRYWWQMRMAPDSLAVRHPVFVIRLRLAVSAWLCFVAAVLIWGGHYAWGVLVLFFVGLHLLFIRRTVLQRRRN